LARCSEYKPCSSAAISIKKIRETDERLLSRLLINQFRPKSFELFVTGNSSFFRIHQSFVRFFHLCKVLTIISLTSHWPIILYILGYLVGLSMVPGAWFGLFCPPFKYCYEEEGAKYGDTM